MLRDWYLDMPGTLLRRPPKASQTSSYVQQKIHNLFSNWAVNKHTADLLRTQHPTLYGPLVEETTSTTTGARHPEISHYVLVSLGVARTKNFHH